MNIVSAGICGIQQAILLLRDGHSLEDSRVIRALERFVGVCTDHSIYCGSSRKLDGVHEDRSRDATKKGFCVITVSFVSYQQVSFV